MGLRVDISVNDVNIGRLDIINKGPTSGRASTDRGGDRLYEYRLTTDDEEVHGQVRHQRSNGWTNLVANVLTHAAPHVGVRL